MWVCDPGTNNYSKVVDKIGTIKVVLSPQTVVAFHGVSHGLVYRARPFSRYAGSGWGESAARKGSAQVTFNWISIAQSDSTTQIWSVINNS